MVKRSDETEQTVEAESGSDSAATESDSDPAAAESDSDPAAAESESDPADSSPESESIDAERATDERPEPRDPKEDQAAERFLELEADLTDAADSPLPDGTIRRGQVVDADRIPVAEVPGDYPVHIDGQQALELTVDIVDGEEVVTYLDWPQDGEPGTDSMLGRLLTALDVVPEQLASLYGKQVLVEVVDGRHTVYVPSEPPRGASSERAIALVLGWSLLSILGAALSGGLLLAGFLVSAFLMTFLVLPSVTYRDAWYLRTHSDWEGGPWFWATLAMLPGINVISTAAYLAQRGDVTFIGE